MLSYDRRHTNFLGRRSQRSGGQAFVMGAVRSIYTSVATQGVNNTAIETSLFPAPGGESAGSTRVIIGGASKAGDLYHIRLEGGYSTVGAGQTARIRGKLNSLTVVDSGVFVVPSSGLGLFEIDYDMLITNPGNPGGINIVNFTCRFAPSVGIQTPTLVYGFGLPAINFLINETIDVTQLWGAADPSNQMNMNAARISMYRPL